MKLFCRAKEIATVIPVSLNEPVGIHALVFGAETVYTRRSWAHRGKVVERSVPFPQGDRVSPILQFGQDFAKAPHSAGVERLIGSPALAPQCAKALGFGSFSGRPIGKLDFHQLAASGATKIDRERHHSPCRRRCSGRCSSSPLWLGLNATFPFSGPEICVYLTIVSYRLTGLLCEAAASNHPKNATIPVAHYTKRRGRNGMLLPLSMVRRRSRRRFELVDVGLPDAVFGFHQHDADLGGRGAE